jgi:hypothetical protein
MMTANDFYMWMHALAWKALEASEGPSPGHGLVEIIQKEGSFKFGVGPYEGSFYHKQQFASGTFMNFVAAIDLTYTVVSAEQSGHWLAEPTEKEWDRLKFFM